MTTVTTHNPVRTDVDASGTAGDRAPRQSRTWALAGIGAALAGVGTVAHQLRRQRRLPRRVQPWLDRRRRRGADREDRRDARLPHGHRARRRPDDRLRRRAVPPAARRDAGRARSRGRAGRARRDRRRVDPGLRPGHRVRDGVGRRRRGRRRRLVGSHVQPLDRHDPVAVDARRPRGPGDLRGLPPGRRAALARPRRPRPRRADRGPGRLAARVHGGRDRRPVAARHRDRLHRGRQGLPRQPDEPTARHSGRPGPPWTGPARARPAQCPGAAGPDRPTLGDPGPPRRLRGPAGRHGLAGPRHARVGSRRRAGRGLRLAVRRDRAGVRAVLRGRAPRTTRARASAGRSAASRSSGASTGWPSPTSATASPPTTRCPG